MIVHFLGPFELIAEKEVQIKLEHSITIRKLLAILVSKYDGMTKYSGVKTNDELSAHLVFFRDGKILMMSDIVDENDVLQVLLPATGG